MCIEICIYVDIVDFGCFVTKKTTFRKMIDLDAKEVMFAMKTMVTLIFEFESNSIHTAMALISQDTIVQL